MTTTIPRGSNYYEEFGLYHGDPTSSLLATLQEVEAGWQYEAKRGGSLSELAMHQLEHIELATSMLGKDSMREFYDEHLSQHRQTSLARDTSPRPAAPHPNWLARAWSLYFARDNFAANAAAHLARQHFATHPMSFVISAWLKLDDDDPTSALEFISVAAALDADGTDAAQIHLVRGVAASELEQYSAAIKRFDHALEFASVHEQAELHALKATAFDRLNLVTPMLQSCRLGMSVSGDIPEESAGTLYTLACRAISLLSGEDSSPQRVSRLREYQRIFSHTSIKPMFKESIASYITGEIQRCSPDSQRAAG